MPNRLTKADIIEAIQKENGYSRKQSSEVAEILLKIIKQNNMACFQMSIDHKLVETHVRCNCGMNYKSVVGMGRIFFVTDNAEKIEALNILMKHYHGQDQYQFKKAYVNETTVLRLDINEISGKKCEWQVKQGAGLPVV